MKRYKFLVSQNNWTDMAKVFVTAKSVVCFWAKDKRPGDNSLEEDGNVILADGVRIEFDEPLQFCGECDEKEAPSK